MRNPFSAGGALTAASPAAMAVASWGYGDGGWQAPLWVTASAALAGVAVLASGLSIERRPILAQWLASVGLAAGLAVGFELLVTSPAATLAVLIGVALTVHGLWPSPWGAADTVELHAEGGAILAAARARSAALVALALWLLTSLNDHQSELVSQAASALAAAIALAWLGPWLARARRLHPIRAGVLATVAALSAVGVALSWGAWDECLSALVPLLVAAALVLPMPPRAGREHVDWLEPLVDQPARFLVITFAALCVLGTVLLALPASASSGVGVALEDAAFTAVSAVCVTGLAVIDTETGFSVFGQVVLLVLIQLGGLGIMTFSTAVMRLLGRRLSFQHEGVAAGLLSAKNRASLFGATRRLLAFTAVIEGAGAAALGLCFWLHGDGLGQALWRGLFTSISAFCNAGFALQGDSLMGYQHQPVILHLTAALIVAGGLSPVAAVALPHWVRGRYGDVPVTAKLGLVATAVLLVAGGLLYGAMEWDSTLAALPLGERLHNIWFQSVTLRTAGFNSLDLTQVRAETLSVMLLWMFIGGNPGGTAGGAKTTTVAVMLLAVTAAIRGRPNAIVFGRRISHRTVYRAAAIATIGVGAIIVALIAIQLTQVMPARLAVFEVVSALATVGLSIGGTAELDGVGKVIIMICMFMGRVGPLTLFMFLQSRVDHDTWRRPEEDIEVG